MRCSIARADEGRVCERSSSRQRRINGAGSLSGSSRRGTVPAHAATTTRFATTDADRERHRPAPPASTCSSAGAAVRWRRPGRSRSPRRAPVSAALVVELRPGLPVRPATIADAPQRARQGATRSSSRARPGGPRRGDRAGRRGGPAARRRRRPTCWCSPRWRSTPRRTDPDEVFAGVSAATTEAIARGGRRRRRRSTRCSPRRATPGTPTTTGTATRRAARGPRPRRGAEPGHHLVVLRRPALEQLLVARRAHLRGCRPPSRPRGAPRRPTGESVANPSGLSAPRYRATGPTPASRSAARPGLDRRDVRLLVARPRAARDEAQDPGVRGPVRPPGRERRGSMSRRRSVDPARSSGWNTGWLEPLADPRRHLVARSPRSSRSGARRPRPARSRPAYAAR